MSRRPIVGAFLIVALVFAFVAAAGVAEGASTEIRFHSQVGALAPGFGVDLNIGDPVVGSFTYRTDLADGDLDPGSGVYEFALESVRMEVAGRLFEAVFSAPGGDPIRDGTLTIGNDTDTFGPGSDFFEMDAIASLTASLDGTVIGDAAFRFLVVDRSGALFDSDALVTALPAGTYANSTYLFGAFSTDEVLLFEGDPVRVPEPGTAWLLGSVLAYGVIGRRR